MKNPLSSVPVGIERESKLRSVWIREGTSADELATKICEVFSWSQMWSLQFMYLCGRHLRPATL